MGSPVALLIAVPSAPAAALPMVPTAAGDMLALRQALEGVGVPTSRLECLIDTAATTTAVRRALRRVARLAAKAERVYFGFAGNVNVHAGDHHLILHDYRSLGRTRGTLPLGQVLEALPEPTRGCVFLAVGPVTGPGGLAGAWDHALLRSLFPAEGRHVVFAAADSGAGLAHAPGEPTSFWLQALVKVVRKSANDASPTTAGAVQTQVAGQFAALLRQRQVRPQPATAFAYGALGQVMFHGGAATPGAKADDPQQAPTQVPAVVEVTLRGTQRVRIKDLAGFQKGHRVPKVINPAARQFVGRLVDVDIRRELATLHREVRRRFGFARHELHLAQDDQGHATLRTPGFDIAINHELDPEDPRYVLVKREISRLGACSLLDDTEFLAFVEPRCPDLVLKWAAAFDVVSWIDRWEALPRRGVELVYPTDGSRCCVMFPGTPTRVEVSREQVEVIGTALGLAWDHLRRFVVRPEASAARPRLATPPT